MSNFEFQQSSYTVQEMKKEIKFDDMAKNDETFITIGCLCLRYNDLKDIYQIVWVI